MLQSRLPVPKRYAPFPKEQTAVAVSEYGELVHSVRVRFYPIGLRVYANYSYSFLLLKLVRYAMILSTIPGSSVQNP